MTTRVLIAFLLYNFAGTDSTGTFCEDAWVPFQGSCYLFGYETGKSFNDAVDYCKFHGATLVHVDDVHENNFLKDYMRRLKPNNYWLGLTDDVIEGEWRWSSTNAIPTFTDWYPGQPESGNHHLNEDCADFIASFDFKWGDHVCSSTFQPLCEKRTTVNRMMDEQLEENPAIREITAAIAEEQASSPDDPIGSVTGLEGQTSDLQLNIKINTHLKAYYQTCPYRAWWLLRGKYYFFNSLADGTKEYYWAYYHWWYVSCGQKYCDVSFKLPWFWFHYHRCFPEYRRVWFWALCLTVQPNGAQTWTSKLIFRTVPRGCCCRRYWKALTVLQCPVDTTG